MSNNLPKYIPSFREVERTAWDNFYRGQGIAIAWFLVIIAVITPLACVATIGFAGPAWAILTLILGIVTGLVVFDRILIRYTNSSIDMFDDYRKQRLLEN